MSRQVIEARRDIRQVASEFGVSTRTLAKWLRRYRLEGIVGLFDRSSRPHLIRRRYPEPSQELQRELFAVLHAPPQTFGINRTTWRMRDLLAVLSNRGFQTSLATVSKLVRDAGYRWRKARVVLTSNDLRFREKVERVRRALAHLGPRQGFFSVDEFGPFAVRMRGGRALMAPGRIRVVPQWQRSKGSLTIIAALELKTNQVTHFYSTQKNTAAMVQLMCLLRERHRDLDRLFLSWDAASWHRSRALFQHIAAYNLTARADNRPTIEVLPLPARAQFLNVIESVFSGMARAIIHNSDYDSVSAAMKAIDAYFSERNLYFQRNPRRAGKKIWRQERVLSRFNEGNNCKDPRYGPS